MNTQLVASYAVVGALSFYQELDQLGVSDRIHEQLGI